MLALSRSLSAELLKLKRTLALWMAFIAPLAVVGLMFIGLISQVHGTPDPTMWESFTNNILTLWSILMLPLFATLEMALLSGMEANEKQWKHLFALPIPRPAIYTAKLSIGLALIGLSSSILCLATLLAGSALRWIRPDLGFTETLPWRELFKTASTAYFGAWLLITLQLWVSLRWQSFTLSVGLGMTATVLGAFAIRNQRWAAWYPWTLPTISFIGEPQIALQAFLVAILGGLIVAILGGWDIVRRDVL